MTATNRDDQLGVIYPMMLNELNCTFGVSFSRFYCCSRHGIGPNCSNIINTKLIDTDVFASLHHLVLLNFQFTFATTTIQLYHKTK